MSTAIQNSTPTPSNIISGQHFLETFTLLPETTKTPNSRWLQSFLSSNSKYDFCYTMANVYPSHIQQCLNLIIHFLLRHLAAKMLSQLHNNFILFPCFFPSYETCSINVNPLFHAAIKNLHIKPHSIFVFVLLSLIYIPLKLSKEVTKHTHARYNMSTLKIIMTIFFAKNVILNKDRKDFLNHSGFWSFKFSTVDQIMSSVRIQNNQVSTNCLINGKIEIENYRFTSHFLFVFFTYGYVVFPYKYIYIYMFGCMYKYVCMYIYIYVYVSVCACIYVYKCVYMYTCIYIYIYLYGCVCRRVHVYLCMCVYIFACIYVYVCTNMCIFIYMCLYTHKTHTHIYIYKLYINYIYKWLCMCIYAYICIYMFLDIYMCVCVCVNIHCVCVYTSLCMYMCVCTYIRMSTYIYIYVCVHVCIYVCVFLWIYVCLYIEIYMRVYIYLCIYGYLCRYIYAFVCVYIY